MNKYLKIGQLAKSGCFICCIAAVSAHADTNEPAILINPTPLIGITGVDDLMSDVEEPNESEAGAMEMQRLFTTKMVASLDNCVSQTRAVFVNWYTGLALLPTSEKVEKYNMTLRLWDKDHLGLFEAGYVLNQDKKFIRASLDYYLKNGEKVSPTSIKQLISTYQINALWNELSGAIECDSQ